MRGIPGSGKSTRAAKIMARFQALFGKHSVKCSADDFFLDKDGNYNFDRNKIGKAHGECKRKAAQAMRKGVPLVVIDNTNTTMKEIRPYLDMAKEHSYTVKYCVVGNTDDDSIKVYAGRNVHGVPEEAIRRMAERLSASLTKGK